MATRTLEQSIFLHALGLGSAGEIASYLDEACAGNAALRADIEALLAAHERLGGGPLLGSTAAEGTSAGESIGRGTGGDGVGSQIGPYKLLEQIGEGGMGTVYMAEQTHPVRRTVALKLVKTGMDSRQVLARFAAERQALALMDHPNIAKVLDAGAAENGRPYFVMELVKGAPITRYCDDHRLTPNERLELFLPVCAAVQHAHQKGIIHRDLKPSNVLVGLYDGKPVPKIIDFGVAKAVGERLTEKTLYTGFGAVIGTPEYMSPEQAQLENIDIDTRSDIYSLGILLYELLTGTTPLQHRRVKEAAVLEVLRLVREEEPPKPSSRLSTTDELPSIAANRNTEPRRLAGLLHGDLDWIIMKALEKDRGRRYETASSFAADVSRYLNHEPVQASQPSMIYRVRKFVRRHRAPLAAGALVLATLIAGGGGVGWVLRDRAMRRTAMVAQVERALDESETRYQSGRLYEALLAADKAKGLVVSGEHNASVLERVSARLSELQLALQLEEARLIGSSVSKDAFFDYSATARAYEDAFREFDLDFSKLELPEVVNRIRRCLIQEHLIAALDHWVSLPNVDEAFRSKAHAILNEVDDDPWRSRLRKLDPKDVGSFMSLAAEIDLDAQPPSTIILLGRSLSNLDQADAAADLLSRARLRFPSDFWINEELAYFLLYCKPGRVDDSIRFHTVAVALRPQSPGAHVRLAALLGRKGYRDEALAEFREAIRLNPSFATAHHNLARFLLSPPADHRAAIQAFSDAVRFDPELSLAWAGRASAYAVLGDWNNALNDSTQALQIDSNSFQAWGVKGSAHANLGDLNAAIDAYTRAIELNPDYLMIYSQRAQTYEKLGQRELAAADRAKAAEIASKLQGAAAGVSNRDLIDGYTRRIEREPAVASHWRDRGVDYQRQGKWNESAADLSKAIELNQGEEAPWFERGQAYYRLGQWQAAVDDFSEFLKDHPKSVPALSERAAALVRLGRNQEAVKDLSLVLEIAPNDLRARYERAHCYRGLRQWDLAISEFSSLMQTNPHHAECVIGRGATYKQMGDYERAVQDFTRALEINPSSSTAWSDRGWCHAELKLWKEAANDYSHLLKLDESLLAYWDFCAMAHLGAGDLASYRALCEKMVARFGETNDTASATRIVGVCVAAPDALEDPLRLVKLAKRAVDNDAEWTQGFFAAALYRANQLNAAWQLASEWTRNHHCRGKDLLLAAMAAHKLNMPEDARLLLERADEWIALAKAREDARESLADPVWENWQEELATRTLRSELLSLMNPTAKETASEKTD